MRVMTDSRYMQGHAVLWWLHRKPKVQNAPTGAAARIQRA